MACKPFAMTSRLLFRRRPLFGRTLEPVLIIYARRNNINYISGILPKIDNRESGRRDAPPTELLPRAQTGETLFWNLL